MNIDLSSVEKFQDTLDRVLDARDLNHQKHFDMIYNELCMSNGGLKMNLAEIHDGGNDLVNTASLKEFHSELGYTEAQMSYKPGDERAMFVTIIGKRTKATGMYEPEWEEYAYQVFMYMTRKYERKIKKCLLKEDKRKAQKHYYTKVKEIVFREMTVEKAIPIACPGCGLSGTDQTKWQPLGCKGLHAYCTDCSIRNQDFNCPVCNPKMRSMALYVWKKGKNGWKYVNAKSLEIVKKKEITQEEVGIYDELN